MDKKIKIYCATALVLVSYNAKAIYNTQASPVARPWSRQGNAVAWKGWSNGSKWQSMAKPVSSVSLLKPVKAWQGQRNVGARKGWSNGSKWQSMAKPVSPLQPVKAWPWLVKTGIERGWSNGSKWQSMAKPVSSVSLLKPVKAWPGNAVAWRGWNNGSKWQSMAKPVSSLQPVKAWPWLVKTGIERGWSNESKWQSMAKPVSSPPPMQPMETKPAKPVIENALSSENRRSAAKPVPSSQEEKAFSWLGKKGLKAFLSSEDSEESTPRSVLSRAAPQPASPRESMLPKGLVNVGNTCYANSVMQLFYGIPEFRESVLKSTSEDPLVYGFQEMFKGLGMSAGIQRDRLRELWTKSIFPNTRSSVGWTFKIGNSEDACGFMEACLNALKENREQAIECFQFKWHGIIHEKSNYDNRISRVSDKLILDLLIDKEHKNEISGEFMHALEAFGSREELNQWKAPDRRKVDAIRCIKIDHPKVLLINIKRLASIGGHLAKIERPISIPLEFTLPEEIMVDPKLAKYKLVGGIVHHGTCHGGHYIAYIKNPNGFWEFNDSRVSQMSNDRALAELKAGTYIVAYRRED